MSVLSLPANNRAKITLALILLGFTAALQSAEYIPGEILVQYVESATSQQIEQLEETYAIGRINYVRSISVYFYRILSDSTVPEMITKLTGDPLVETVEPNYLNTIQSFTMPTDPGFGNLWHLKNDGQVVNGWLAESGFDIKWSEAMEIYEPKGKVVVAILDSGTALDHPEFYTADFEESAFWINELEYNGTAFVDDDQNGYIDDVVGWDFFDNDPLPFDENGHGTLVASIIGGLSGNGIPGFGISQDVELMTLRVGNDLGQVSQSAWLAAMEYASENGAQILNCSFGSRNYSSFAQSMLSMLEDKGILVVCAAGNQGSDNDITPYYPASYLGSNVLSVGAVDPMGNLSYYSNYGKDSVWMVAPGSSIYGAAISRKNYYVENFDSTVEGWITYPIIGNLSQFTNWGVFEYLPGNYALADSVFQNGELAYYESNTNTVAESPLIDLAGLNGPLLEFDIASQLEGRWFIFDTDLLFVEASTDGSSWSIIDTIYGAGAFSSLRNVRIDLSRYQGQSIYIRFRLKTDSFVNYLGVLIDNFTVSEVKTFEYSGIEHQFNDGTSFAAPVVTGVASLLLAQRPELRGLDLKLLMGISALVEPHESLEGKSYTGGLINAEASLGLSDEYAMAGTRLYINSVAVNPEWGEHQWLGLMGVSYDSFTSDWVYHANHGWIHGHVDTEYSFYFFSPDYGWFWISSSSSPYAYSISNPGWYLLNI